MAKKKKTKFNDYYYDKFRNDGFWGKYILTWIDRKEPVFSKLKKMRAKASTLLDIGCGNGRFLEHAQHYFDCVGIDTSSAALKQAKNYAPKATLKKISAYELTKLKGKKFDIITCFDILEHLVDYNLVLHDAYKLLKPGGLFVFSVPNGSCIGKRVNLEKWWAFQEVDHMWFLTPQQWHFELEKNGFVPLDTYHNGLMHPPYIGWLPVFLQTLLIKYPTQLISLFGFPLPSWCGEVFFTIAYKNPGWDSDNYKEQMKALGK